MSQLQINFRSISPSPAVKYNIEKYFKKINRIYHKIQTCKVTIDVTKKNVHKIKLFTISIDITIPGKELVTRKQNNNLHIAIRDGFCAAEKLLDKYCKRKQTTFDKNAWYIKNTDDRSNPIEIGLI
jgi:ribosome-associated translation inhibitor RaiA